MELFKKAFTSILEQDKEKGVAQAPTSDRDAMKAKLDSAKPEDFDVQAPVITDTEKMKQEQLNSLKSWIGQIDQFIEFLNGTDSKSIQSQLHAAACETVFQDIARSEKKKIARLAAELSSLSESFKGYLISSGTD
jgi:hypothetical protein